MEAVVEEIDRLISEIDNGLVTIYQAFKKGGHYSFFDFENRLKRLLTLYADSSEYRRNYILKFYYIFSELYSNGGADIAILKEIKEEASKLVIEKIKHRSFSPLGSEVYEIEINDYYKSEIQTGALTVGQELFSYGLTKLQCLLANCTKDDEGVLNDSVLQDFYFDTNSRFSVSAGESGLERSYKAAGFNSRSELIQRPYTFEQHVKQLLIVSHGVRVKEIKVESPSLHNDTQGQPLKVDEGRNGYLLDLEILGKVLKSFNGDLWEKVEPDKFLAVFSVGSKAVLKIYKKERFYALLKCMYKCSGSPVDQGKWVEPLIERHKLSQSGFNSIDGKLFNKAHKNPDEKAFLKALGEVLPISEK